MSGSYTDDYIARYQDIVGTIDKLKIDAFLVSNPTNIRYLTGLLLSDAELLLTPGESTLFVDSRYLLQAQKSKFTFNVNIVQLKNKYEDVNAWLDNHKLHAIGVESGFLSHQAFLKWQEKISGQLIPCENIIERLRIRKGAYEIKVLQKAIDIAARVIQKIPNILQKSIGATEKDVAVEIEYLIKKEGAERPAFDIIVAAGERSAMPHAAPTERKIRAGEVVLIDMGAVYEGYCSDLTRIFFLSDGKKNNEVENLFNILQLAQKAAVQDIRPGVSAHDVDASARRVIEEAGYGSFFDHGTGHGVGLDVHEDPRISPPSEMILQEGMVFTIEPGIYLPDKFGLRLEDIILVTDQGPLILSRSVPQNISWI